MKHLNIIGLGLLTVFLTGCATICPATIEQLPFNVDATLMQPPQKLKPIILEVLTVTPKNKKTLP